MKRIVFSPLLKLGAVGASYFLNECSISEERKLHDDELEYEKSHFEDSIELAKKTHLLDIFADFERHIQQLNSDLIYTSHEADRDIFEQRCQLFQTMIVAGTIMLLALISVFIQGTLPNTQRESIFIAYSIFNPLSLVVLTTSIVICFYVVHKASEFMFERSESYTELLKSSVQENQGMMEALRKERYDGIIDENNIGVSASNTGGKSSLDQQHQEDIITHIQSKFSEMTNFIWGYSHVEHDTNKPNVSTVDERFEKHEELMERYIGKREEIQEKMANFKVHGPGFEIYWGENLQWKGDAAIYSFYVGTIFMIIATAIYMYTYFVENKSDTSAIVSVVILSAAGLAGVGVVLYFRDFSSLFVCNNTQTDPSLSSSPPPSPCPDPYRFVQDVDGKEEEEREIEESKSSRDLPLYIANRNLLVSTDSGRRRVQPISKNTGMASTSTLHPTGCCFLNTSKICDGKRKES